MDTLPDPSRLETFEQYRPLLFSIAYRMLGTTMDAEDMVQETWLRFRDVDETALDSPRAYLATIVTRLSINQLNSARARRESYIGPWLPEPVLTDGNGLMAAPGAHLSQSDSISMAFLVLLESLTPAERAAFLLHEVFDYSYPEIAAILERSEAACRQLVSRARRHIDGNRPRFNVSPEAHEKLVRAFFMAVEAGDVDQLAALLADDVVVYTDGGGKVTAALQPIQGRDNAARFILGSPRFAPGPIEPLVETINGRPALVLRNRESGVPFLVVDIDGIAGAVSAIRVVGNPDKLLALRSALTS